VDLTGGNLLESTKIHDRGSLAGAFLEAKQFARSCRRDHGHGDVEAAGGASHLEGGAGDEFDGNLAAFDKIAAPDEMAGGRVETGETALESADVEASPQGAAAGATFERGGRDDGSAEVVTPEFVPVGSAEG